MCITARRCDVVAGSVVAETFVEVLAFDKQQLESVDLGLGFRKVQRPRMSQLPVDGCTPLWTVVCRKWRSTRLCSLTARRSSRRSVPGPGVCACVLLCERGVCACVTCVLLLLLREEKFRKELADSIFHA